jgi:hypothetical protein
VHYHARSQITSLSEKMQLLRSILGTTSLNHLPLVQA